jgi:hypothetical protein
MLEKMINMDADEMAKADETIKNLLPLAIDKINLLTIKEKEWRKKHNLSDDDIILYTQMKTQDDKKIIFSILGCSVISENVKIGGREFSAGSLIVHTEIENSFDLIQWIKDATEHGLKSLIDKFI